MKEVHDDDLIVGKKYRYMTGVNEVGNVVFYRRENNKLTFKCRNIFTVIHYSHRRIWRYYDEDNELKFGR